MTASMKLPRCLRRTFFGAAATALLASCQIGEPYRPEPRPGLGKYLAERAALIVTLPEKDATALLQKFHSSTQSTLSLSTATPVSAEGHFLTSAHSVKALRPGDVSVILYSPGKHQRQGRVEILWQDESADLALVRAPFPTPFYYSWLPRDKWLAPGTQVIHGGITTGPEANVGQLLTAVSGIGSRRSVRHTLRLKPGDSGGPLLTASAELIGINRAVGYMGVMDTTFFTESHSMRPDPARIQTLMNRFQRP